MEHVRLGNTQGVQLFLDSNPPKSDIQKLVYWAANNGQVQCLSLLLAVALVPGSHIKFNDALMAAASNGHVECVKVLLPMSSSLGRIDALLRALAGDKQYAFDLLLPVCDPFIALDKIQYEYSEEPQLYEKLEQAFAQQQKQVLERSVVGSLNAPTQKTPVRKI